MKVKFERCKKIFSMFLIIVLLFGILPVSALQGNVSDSTTSRIVKEIVEMREESVKYFICEDGSYIAATYSSPVHYEESGKWEEIDNTLTLNTKSGEAVYSTKNGFDVTIPQNLTSGRSITATNKGYTVSFKIKGDTNDLNMRTTASVVDTDKLPSVVKMNDTVKMTGEVSASADISSSGTLTEGQKIEKFNAEKMTVENQTSAVVYKNFLNRSDLEYVVTSNSLKENIVVMRRKVSTYIGLTLILTDSCRPSRPTVLSSGQIRKIPMKRYFFLMRRICMMQTITRALMFQCPLKLMATVMC